MSGPSDAIPVPASPLLQAEPRVAEGLFEEQADSDRVFQEINARRALVERPELLRGLRGL
ncbi:hypothetical protein [Phenylobacterium hankyongense]|uniref:hypothetical protein n=1 Tax=Phenylobacterium hankyongense TaxID=1813876 RepID=UPI001057E65F|nr:hypothetical protein [Phenylobacterium hankyongense]